MACSGRGAVAESSRLESPAPARPSTIETMPARKKASPIAMPIQAGASPACGARDGMMFNTARSGSVPNAAVRTPNVILIQLEAGRSRQLLFQPQNAAKFVNPLLRDHAGALVRQVRGRFRVL